MKRVLFIDRDGTLIQEPEDQKIDSLEKLEFLPGVFGALARIARTQCFDLVIVSNQDGLGTTEFPEAAFRAPHEKMLRAFEKEGVTFAQVLIDSSYPEDNLPTRKPGVGMLSAFLHGNYDLRRSFVIGDRLTDIELAKNLGATGILIGADQRRNELDSRGLTPWCPFISSSWSEIASFILDRPRRATVMRSTRETTVLVKLNLDGEGRCNISTGLRFFDHMLDQLAVHSGIDLEISSTGDLHIDEHHTIEDTALALGDALLEALGDRRGIGRYGFCLPMDDALAQVALDFGGRPWLEWSASFSREKIGDLPTEMFSHFFKSLSDRGQFNINIKAEGSNEHHKIEAIFKAIGKSLKMALKREGDKLPTTKGYVIHT